jgi:hypothetical protein
MKIKQKEDGLQFNMKQQLRELLVCTADGNLLGEAHILIVERYTAVTSCSVHADTAGSRCVFMSREQNAGKMA